MRYKARLVAQGSLQRPGIDFEETYSPVMDACTFRYLISLVAKEELDIHLMDVVTAYLYGSLDNEIYMKLQKDRICPVVQVLKVISQLNWISLFMNWNN